MFPLTRKSISIQEVEGSHTFTDPSAAVEDHETEEDSGPQPNGKKEAESSAEEDVGMSGEVGDIDLSLGNIMWFANVVEIY